MIFKLAIKTGLAYASLHYSCKLGVWGSSEQSEQLYNDLKGHARPHVVELKKKLPFEVPALPQTGEVRYLIKHYYNNGVKSTFGFIQMLPCYAGQIVKKTKDSINKALDPSAMH